MLHYYININKSSLIKYFRTPTTVYDYIAPLSAAILNKKHNTLPTTHNGMQPPKFAFCPDLFAGFMATCGSERKGA